MGVFNEKKWNENRKLQQKKEEEKKSKKIIKAKETDPSEENVLRVVRNMWPMFGS